MTTFTTVDPTAPMMTEDQLRLLTYVQAHPTPRLEVDRDQYGRYKLVDPATGRVRGWTRATTLASTIDDTYSLTRWANRLTAVGIATNPHLAAALAALEDPHGADKGDAQRIAEQAKALAGGSLSAEIGTAIHCLTEHYDLDTPTGRDLSVVGEPWAGDVLAYAAALRRADIEVPAEWVERIVIIPELGVAGTLDRIITLPDGRNVILDVKTGSSIDHSIGTIAAQLALYSRATHMVGPDGYEAMPPVDQGVALVAHLPAGSNTCTLHEVDIARGWELAQLCHTVREARKWGKKLGRVHGPALTVTSAVTIGVHPSVEIHTESTWVSGTIESSGTTTRPIIEADIVSRTKRITTDSPELVPALRLAWDASGIAKRPPWTPSEVEALHDMLLGVEFPEAAMVAPDPTPVPEAPPAPVEPPLAPLPSPDDGHAEVDGTRARDALNALRGRDADGFERVKTWAADSRDSNQPWKSSERGQALTLAAVALADVMWQTPIVGQGHDRVRAILAYVTQADVYLDARHTIGACIGSLTGAQAHEVTDVCACWRTDKALRDLIGGIAREATTGEHTTTTTPNTEATP